MQFHNKLTKETEGYYMNQSAIKDPTDFERKQMEWSKKKDEVPAKREPIVPVVSIQDQLNFWNYLNDIQYASLNASLMTKPNTWLVTHKGTWLVQKNGSGYYGLKTDDVGIPTLPKIDYHDAFFELAYGKIPNAILDQIIGFFREVMKRHNDAEAFLQVYWDKQENKYIVHVPKQQISKASVRYDATENLNAKDRERYVFVYECHSHNSMGAFWSGTDDRDEKELRLYGVFGQLDKDKYACKHRFFVDSKQVDVSIDLVFNIPKEEEKQYLITHKNKQYLVPGDKLLLDEAPKYILELEGQKHYVPVESVVLHRSKVDFPEGWFTNINVPFVHSTYTGPRSTTTYERLSYGKKDEKAKPKDFSKTKADPFYSRDFDTFEPEDAESLFDYEEALEEMSDAVDQLLDLTNGLEDPDATRMFLENLEFKSCLKDLEMAIHNYYVLSKEAEEEPTDGRY